MNKLLDFTSPDKTRSIYVRTSGDSRRSPIESNDQVISRLQDLVASAPLDGDSLTLLVDLLVKCFNWRTATAEEIDKCKNIVLDLVSIDGDCVNWLVKRFISHFRSTDKEHLKVDICSRMFDSIMLLKKHIREILTKSPDDVDLTGENYELLYELLGCHSSGRVKENVVAIFPSTHKNPRFKGLRCFFYRHRDGHVEFFSYARCCDNVKTRGQILREYVCDMLVEIYRLTPSVLGTITETIDSSYPHHNVQIEHHISFTKAILYISRRIPCLRSVLYKILISKLTVIDSEIKLADPNAVDVEKVENLRSVKLRELADQLINGQTGADESKSKLENPDWFKNIYEKLRTEEDIDDMSQKLDFLMGIMFEELEHVLKDNLELPHKSSSSETLNYSSDSDDEAVATPLARNSRNSLSTADTCYSRSSFEDAYATSATVCSSVSVDSSDLSDLFKSDTEKGRSVEHHFKSEVGRNGIGAVKREARISRSDGWAASRAGYTVSDMIVIDLFDTFDQIILPTYNCKYVQFIYFFVLSFNQKWARMFLQRLFSIVYDGSQHVIKRRAAASYVSSLICRSNYLAPQFVCGSLNHMFGLLSFFEHLALNSDNLRANPGKPGLANKRSYHPDRRSDAQQFSLGSTKLSLFYSILQDILYIICYRTDLISASPTCLAFIQDPRKGLVAYLDSYLKPLSYCKDAVLSEAIKSTAHFPNLSALHKYLVAAQAELAGTYKSSDDFKWGLYSPIDSFFPFDPYLLNHSRYYIRDKYRSETASQIIEAKHEVALEAVKNEQGFNIRQPLLAAQMLGHPGGQASASDSKHDKIINALVEAIKNEKELVEHELKDVSRQVHDSMGFSAISRSIKARLDSFKRTFSVESGHIEADYDFWDYETSLQELEKPSDPYTSPRIHPRAVPDDIEMEDFELTLYPEVPLEGVQPTNGLLALLTSSKAYKSAAVNCKRAREAIA